MNLEGKKYLVPPVGLPPKRFKELFNQNIAGADMDELMKNDRLFLVGEPEHLAEYEEERLQAG